MNTKEFMTAQRAVNIQINKCYNYGLEPAFLGADGKYYAPEEIVNEEGEFYTEDKMLWNKNDNTYMDICKGYWSSDRKHFFEVR